MSKSRTRELLTNNEKEPLIRDGLLRTIKLRIFLWESVKEMKRSSIDSLGVVGECGDAAGRKARGMGVFVPTNLQTTMRDSMSGRRTVAMCSVSEFSPMLERQSPNLRQRGVNLKDS